MPLGVVLKVPLGVVVETPLRGVVGVPLREVIEVPLRGVVERLLGGVVGVPLREDIEVPLGGRVGVSAARKALDEASGPSPSLFTFVHADKRLSEASQLITAAGHVTLCCFIATPLLLWTLES